MPILGIGTQPPFTQLFGLQTGPAIGPLFQDSTTCYATIDDHFSGGGGANPPLAGRLWTSSGGYRVNEDMPALPGWAPVVGRYLKLADGLQRGQLEEGVASIVRQMAHDPETVTVFGTEVAHWQVDCRGLNALLRAKGSDLRLFAERGISLLGRISRESLEGGRETYFFADELFSDADIDRVAMASDWGLIAVRRKAVVEGIKMLKALDSMHGKVGYDSVHLELIRRTFERLGTISQDELEDGIEELEAVHEGSHLDRSHDPLFALKTMLPTVGIADEILADLDVYARILRTRPQGEADKWLLLKLSENLGTLAAAAARGEMKDVETRRAFHTAVLLKYFDDAEYHDNFQVEVQKMRQAILELFSPMRKVIDEKLRHAGTVIPEHYLFDLTPAKYWGLAQNNLSAIDANTWANAIELTPRASALYGIAPPLNISGPNTVCANGFVALLMEPDRMPALLRPSPQDKPVHLPIPLTSGALEQLTLAAVKAVEKWKSQSGNSSYLDMIPAEYRGWVTELAEESYPTKGDGKSPQGFLELMAQFWLAQREIFKVLARQAGFSELGAGQEIDKRSRQALLVLTMSGSIIGITKPDDGTLRHRYIYQRIGIREDCDIEPAGNALLNVWPAVGRPISFSNAFKSTPAIAVFSSPSAGLAEIRESVITMHRTCNTLDQTIWRR